MKAKTIRRIIGITTLVLWVLAIVPKFACDCLVWQLDNWALVFASVFTLAYAVMLTVQSSKGKPWYNKLLKWIGCIVVAFVCIFIFFWANVFRYVNIWHDRNYVVYSEWGGFTDPDVYVLYKRNGFENKRMYIIGSDNFRQIKNIQFAVYEPLDLIESEFDVTAFESDSVYSHDTVFYRLSNGQQYDQEQNDSLFALIK